MADYQIVAGDDGKVLNVDSSQGQSVLILPAPTAAFKVTVKDIGGMAAVNKINVFRNGSELIDNVAADSIIDENNAAVSFISDGTNWSRFDSLHRNVIATSGRGVFAGGTNLSAPQATIDYVIISTLSNAVSFGNLSVTRSSLGACSSTTRGLFAGGENSTPVVVNTIDYITIATTGNATDFGDLTVAKERAEGCGSQTRGLFGGGDTTAGGGSDTNVIEYVTIATLVNAIDFGDLTVARRATRALSSSTRGVWGGGITGAVSAVMDYVTIATLGNAISFGNLTVARQGPAACANSIRGLFAGGTTGSDSNVIDYITIATTGNAIDFGDLTVARRRVGGASSSTRGVFGGGITGSASDVVDYVTLSTLGNALDFGDLTVARGDLGSCSSSHGGLNG